MPTTNLTKITLGKLITAPALIPVHHAASPACINEPFMVGGEAYNITCLSFGAMPYGAMIVDDADQVDVAVIGSALSCHARFPKGASIVFVESDGESLKARLWQRGEGEREYYAEAAGAAVIAACMTQKLLKDEADITMGGHTVHISWDRAGGNVELTAPE